MNNDVTNHLIEVGSVFNSLFDCVAKQSNSIECKKPYEKRLLELQNQAYLDNIIPQNISYMKMYQDNEAYYNETHDKQSMKKAEKTLSNNVNHLLTKLNLDENTILNTRIQNTFKENTELRDRLELQLQELYGKRNARLMDSDSIMNASTYATLMWTIIASCSLYYILLHR